jgi:hypothetical protein
MWVMTDWAMVLRQMLPWQTNNTLIIYQNPPEMLDFTGFSVIFPFFWEMPFFLFFLIFSCIFLSFPVENW